MTASDNTEPDYTRAACPVTIENKDGLPFKFIIHRLRGFRAARAMSALAAVLGANALTVLGGGAAGGVTATMLIQAGGLRALVEMVTTSILTGKLGDPDGMQKGARELFPFDEETGGVQIVTSGSAMGIGSLDSFANFDGLGAMVIMELGRHMIVHNFRPTSPGTTTSDGTGPGASTSAKDSSPVGAPSGGKNSPPTSSASGMQEL